MVNTASKAPLSPHNPLPLSTGQESQVLDLYYKRVRGYCADEIREFAMCTANRTVSMAWACRSHRLAMNSCMIKRATQQEKDDARAEWFATMDVRAREHEEREKKRKHQEKLHKEWWGLPMDSDEKPGDEKPGDEKLGDEKLARR